MTVMSSVIPAGLRPMRAAVTDPGAAVVDNGDVAFAGMLLAGESAPVWLTELTGWDDLPGIDTGNVARPTRHGSWPGTPLGEERVVTLKASINAATDAELVQAVRTIRAATAIAGDAVEQPLVIRAVGETLLAWGHVTGRVIPQDITYAWFGGEVTIQITCSDPRRYGLDEHGVTLTPSVSRGGLTWPLAWPLTWNTSAGGGSRIAATSGDVPTYPVITIPGPYGTPRIINRTTGVVVEVGITLADGDTLVIDTGAGTVTLNGSADRLYALTSRSDPPEAFQLIPGAGGNDLALSAASAGTADSDPPPVEVRWRDATI